MYRRHLHSTLFVLLFTLAGGTSNFAQTVALNVTNLNPHIGQKFEARIIDKSTLMETDRASLEMVAGADFVLNMEGEMGKSYFIDFYADLNKNGSYNAPPVDHAWRLEVDNVGAGVNTVDFSHNTNFVDIKWKSLLTMEFTGMTPHIGQMLEVRVREMNNSGKEVGRFSMPSIPMADFSIDLPFIEIGKSYMVDYYADLNKNGVYDAPPVDHAWREMIMNVAGDTNLAVSHNTNFTDVQWKHLLTFNFKGMTPHIGQQLEIRVRDVNQTGREVGRFTMPAIPLADFEIALPYLELGRTYLLDFYADLNKNGIYDAPPVDHAWREMIKEVSGDTSLEFSHNTSFTDIGESNTLTMDFTNMTPHVGQQLELRVIETATGKEVERVKQMIAVVDFKVTLPGIKSGLEYNIDFYADLNQNGLYDAPPVDHAWRQTMTAGDGNQVVPFSHNTDFTDVDWVYQMTLAAVNMNPHLGQLFELRVVNTENSSEVGRFQMPSVMVPFFFVRVPGLRVGENYDADFYADFNKNGEYDAPPTDHAWRVNFDDDDGDEVVDFAHNTDFTDIMLPSGTQEITALERMNVFPNPFSDAISVSLSLTTSTDLSVRLYNSMGQLTKVLWDGKLPAGENTMSFGDLADLSSGIYFMEIRSVDGGTSYVTLVK